MAYCVNDNSIGFDAVQFGFNIDSWYSKDKMSVQNEEKDEEMGEAGEEEKEDGKRTG